MLWVEPETYSNEAVSIRAEKGSRVLTWDPHPKLAAALKRRLEAQGWQVTLSTSGPKRRLLPRIGAKSA